MSRRLSYLQLFGGPISDRGPWPMRFAIRCDRRLPISGTRNHARDLDSLPLKCSQVAFKNSIKYYASVGFVCFSSEFVCGWSIVERHGAVERSV